VWRDKARVPADLIFDVSYLGGDMPTLGLNFSRPGAQVLLQYYMFLRLGYDGFRKVQQATQDVAHYPRGRAREDPGTGAVERRQRHPGVRLAPARRSYRELEPSTTCRTSCG